MTRKKDSPKANEPIDAFDRGRRRVNFEESTDVKSVEVVHVEPTVLTIVY